MRSRCVARDAPPADLSDRQDDLEEVEPCSASSRGMFVRGLPSVRPLQGRFLSFRAFPQVSPSAPRSGWQLLDSFAVCLHQGVHPFLFIVQSGGHAGPPLRRHVRRDGTLNAEKRCRGRPACLPGVHGLAVLQHRPSLSGGSRVVGFKKRR